MNSIAHATRLKWLQLASCLLDMAAEEFGTRICNDWRWPKDWTEAERRELAVAMVADNVRKPVSRSGYGKAKYETLPPYPGKAAALRQAEDRAMKGKHPAIQDAKDLAYKYRKSGIIILHFDGGTFGTASYGMTREKCDEMRKIADMIFQRFIDVGGVEVVHDAH